MLTCGVCGYAPSPATEARGGAGSASPGVPSACNVTLRVRLSPTLNGPPDGVSDWLRRNALAASTGSPGLKPSGRLARKVSAGVCPDSSWLACAGVARTVKGAMENACAWVGVIR